MKRSRSMSFSMSVNGLPVCLAYSSLSFLRIVRVEEQQLRDDDVGDLVVDRRPEEHDAIHQEPAEDVVGALAPAGALDDVGRIDLVDAHGCSTVDWDMRNANTFSSVRPRSRSRRRF